VISIIVFLIIAAILVLLFSVRVSVNMELKDEFRLSLWVFGIKIRLLPKKEKKYKIRDYTPKKIAKREKKAQKLAEKKAAKKAEKLAKKKARKAEEKKLSKAERKALKKQKKASRPPVTDMVSFFSELARLFLSTFFSHLHIKTSRIRIKVGGPDAAQVALRWSAIYTAYGALITILDSNSNLHGQKRADVCIEPDYLSDSIEADLKLSFSMNLFGLLCVIFKCGIKGIVGWFNIQPTPPQTSTNTASSTNQNHVFTNSQTTKKI